MSVEANFFIPHEHYRMDSVYRIATQKVLPADRLKGKILLLMSAITLVASAILFAGSAVAAATGVAIYSSLSLLSGIYCYFKKTTDTEIAAPQLGNRTINRIIDCELDVSAINDENGKNRIIVNFLSLLHLPEFRAKPVQYLEKWEQMRGGKPEFKVEEDFLINHLNQPEVRNLLSETTSGIPKICMPHEQYKWSTTPAGTKLNCDQLCDLFNLILLGDEREDEPNIYAILLNKNFIANPQEYISKWKQSRNKDKDKIFRLTEDPLLDCFASQRIGDYLSRIRN